MASTSCRAEAMSGVEVILRDLGVYGLAAFAVGLLAVFGVGLSLYRSIKNRSKGTGLAARVNLFGYIVGQIYLAFPFQRPQKTTQFGFVIASGW